MIKRVKLPRFPQESRRVALKIVGIALTAYLLSVSVWLLQDSFARHNTYISAMAANYQAKEVETSGIVTSHPLLKDSDGNPLRLPNILSERDRALYRQAIAAQDEKNWTEASRVLSLVHDKVLVGHVLAERFLRKKYVSTYGELSRWLNQNGDDPDAGAVKRLALAKKPRNIKEQTAEVQNSEPLKGYADSRSRAHSKQYASSNDWDDRLQARAVWAKIKTLVHDNQMEDAVRVLHSPGAAALTTIERDLCQWHIASGYFAHGQDSQAYRLANESSSRSGDVIPGVRWVAGISAWRLGNIQAAARHFSTMADQGSLTSPWDISAAAYWAHRAYDRAGNSSKASHYLAKAAETPRTFYGILARRQLGQSLDLDLKPASLQEQDIATLYQLPAVRRAVALTEIGEENAAEAELRTLFPRSNYALRQQLLTITMALGIPGVQMPMGRSLAKEDGRSYDFASYPVPGWTPEGGYQVDPALIFALARQESGFHAAARSRNGALGLMQLMPQTARYIAHRIETTPGQTFATRTSYIEPVANIMLGESYVQYLMEQNYVKDNLFYLAAAYNAGPGKVAEWQTTLKYNNDPLLFMESIPYPETRNYIGQIMASYWIYSEILGRPTRSIQAIVNGRWPTYRWDTQEFASVGTGISVLQ